MPAIGHLRRAGRRNRIPAIKISPTGTNGPNADPTFRSRPDLVSGIPSFLEMCDLSPEIPRNLHQENPPLFICQHPSPSCELPPEPSSQPSQSFPRLLQQSLDPASRPEPVRPDGSYYV